MANTKKKEWWTVKELSQQFDLSEQRIGVLLKQLKLDVRYIHKRMRMVPDASAAELAKHIEQRNLATNEVNSEDD